VFRRSANLAASPEQTTDALARSKPDPGKGKATPKRREAEARRRTSVIAQGSRGAGRGRGGRESREQYALRREAIKRGDESALPARDRGPVRRFVRDYVDSRRSIASLFMPVGLPIILLSYTGIPLFQLLGVIALWVFVVGVVVDSAIMTRRIRREVSIRFPGESTKGLGFYAITRALQFRRVRLPAPRVSKGAKI
jgi:hypothetical protein